MSFYSIDYIDSISKRCFALFENINRIRIILLLIFFFYIIFFSHNSNNSDLIYEKYIHDCNKGKKYFKNIHFKKNNYNYISICVPVYNMVKYIETSLLSVLNQSFKNYEIILVNDNSNDKTIEIIQKYQNNDDRIKVINHQMQLGVYCSRKDAILNANGEFILMMDPDDMLLNPKLFKELFNYNSKYNLDIIEFLVFHQNENEDKIYTPIGHIYNHWHDFGKTIIYQPELSNILFNEPKSNNITSIICRTIWNKIIRQEIMIKAVYYVERFFKSRFLITADDTPINVMVFNYARNYSNLKIPGYLYIKKNISMSRGQHVKELDQIRGYNFLLFYTFFIHYIKEYSKDINYFFKDFDGFHHDLYKIKNLNITYYIPKTIKFLNNLLKIKNVPKTSEIIIKKLLLHFQKNIL